MILITSNVCYADVTTPLGVYSTHIPTIDVIHNDGEPPAVPGSMEAVVTRMTTSTREALPQHLDMPRQAPSKESPSLQSALIDARRALTAAAAAVLLSEGPTGSPQQRGTSGKTPQAWVWLSLAAAQAHPLGQLPTQAVLPSRGSSCALGSKCAAAVRMAAWHRRKGAPRRQGWP